MRERTPNLRDQPNQPSIFQRLFDKSRDAVVITNSEGRITSVSPQLEQWFGYSGHELIGKSILILVPNRSRIAFSTARRPHPGGATVDLSQAGSENLGRRKDGSEFPIEIHYSFVESPEGRLVVCVFRDPSARPPAPLPISNEEPLFRTLFEFSPDAIVASNR